MFEDIYQFIRLLWRVYRMAIKRPNKHRPPRGPKLRKLNQLPGSTVASISAIAVVSTHNLQIDFAVPVVCQETPGYLSNGTIAASGFVQNSPTRVTVNYASGTPTSMVVPKGDQSIKAANGGLVPPVTYAVPFP